MSKKRKVIEEVKIPWYRKVKKSTWIMTAIIVAMVFAAAAIIIYAHVDTYSKLNYDKVLAYTKTIKKGKVKKGDTVVIDYSGKIDGKKFDGGTAEKQKLKIGSGKFIPGFEDALIGKKIGEECTINVTFPKDYQAEDLAGKDAEFDVTIRSKKEKVTYEYNNKFIRDTSKYFKKSSYEKAVKKELEEQARENAESTLEEELWQKVLNKTEIKKYPKGLLKEEIPIVQAQYARMAEQYGMSVEQMGITEDQYKEFAKQSLKEKLTLHAIAKEAKIKVTRKDKKAFYDEILENSQMTEEEFEQATEMSVEDWVKANHYEIQPLRDKVLDYIRENGKITEKQAKAESTEKQEKAKDSEKKDQ